MRCCRWCVDWYRDLFREVEDGQLVLPLLTVEGLLALPWLLLLAGCLLLDLIIDSRFGPV